MKRMFFAAAAAAAALVAGTAIAQEPIKIGIITDRVGVSKPYSEPCTEGVIFGAEEINRASRKVLHEILPDSLTGL